MKERGSKQNEEKVGNYKEKNMEIPIQALTFCQTACMESCPAALAALYMALEFARKAVIRPPKIKIIIG